MLDGAPKLATSARAEAR